MHRLIPIAPAAAVLLVAACTAPLVSTAPPSAAPTDVPTAAPTARASTPTPATATPEPLITPSPSPRATAPPATAPATAFPDGSVIVTFAVEDEQFKVLLTDPADIEIARALLAGEEAPPIPNGLVVYGDPGVNAPWSWQLAPDTIEFADVTMEVCDGLPSYIENRIVTGDRFCPWSAQVLAVEPAAE